MNTDGINALVGDQNIQLCRHMKDTIKDLKLKTKISGLGGADCLLYKPQAKDWTDKSKATEGYKINRTAAETISIYQPVLNDNDEIVVQPKDFETRSGVNSKAHIGFRPTLHYHNT